MLPGGAAITLPSDGPAPTAITYTNWEADLGAALAPSPDVMAVEELGNLRVEVLRRVAGMRPTEQSPSSDVTTALYALAAETVRTVAQLARQQPRPAMLWNQELDLAQFLGRTLLLADHVLYPDRVFDTLRRSPTMQQLVDDATAELKHADLLSGGIAIPVPPGVAMAAQGPVAQELTAGDLQQSELVSWVRTQLIIEGPTAREALFVRAADDLAREPVNFWLHGHIDRESLDEETGHFRTLMLQPFDSRFDYESWIAQVKNSAISALVQRTHERVVAADVFGAEYVSASLFEARLLRTRERTHRMGPAQAAVWADIPELTSLSGGDLVKLLKNEAAVADLRHQVRASLMTARSDGDKIDAITELSHQLEAASHSLQKVSASDRTWKAVLPGGLTAATMVVGGITGGLAGVGLGAVGVLATLAPSLGDRLNSRRRAAYVYVAARRTRRSR
ncbi:hypothetical protein [Nocardioides sp. W7]|uniref:hypothetical protein n=1 Tax=Nocardioides sp. W7 TaxID=2931390 RepID=UPI001FD561F6|nr:hypothetical protein [Nocardioides sp. W7]